MEETRMATPEEQQELFTAPQDASEITVKQLDNMVEVLALCRAEKKRIEALKKEAHLTVVEAEHKVMHALELLGKKSYKAEGIGTITRVDKLVIQVPKTPKDKLKMFDWITETLGEEGYFAYATVDSQALTKLYNKQAEERAEKGEIFSMPGVDIPTTRTTLSFRSN